MLGGLSDENQTKIVAKLQTLGIIPNAGTTDSTPMDVDNNNKRGRQAETTGVDASTVVEPGTSVGG